jgi:multidrug efflux pump subunit AcrA (membrane-fusion protein)
MEVVTWTTLLAATPLPLLVRSMAPEVIRSMPAIHVGATPFPVEVSRILEGPNPWLVFIGSVALTAAAVIVGVWTLRKVYAQIKIANDQLEVANKELLAVRDDFRLSQEQFELSQKQFALAQEQAKVFMRRPDMTLEAKVDPVPVAISPALRGFKLIGSVSNRGDRIAKDVIFEVSIAESLNPNFAIPTYKNYGCYMATKMVSGVAYRIFTANLNEIHPNEAYYQAEFPTIAVARNVESVPMLLRVYDETYPYPEAGPETLTYTFPVDKLGTGEDLTP